MDMVFLILVLVCPTNSCPRVRNSNTSLEGIPNPFNRCKLLLVLCVVLSDLEPRWVISLSVRFFGTPVSDSFLQILSRNSKSVAAVSGSRSFMMVFINVLSRISEKVKFWLLLFTERFGPKEPLDSLSIFCSADASGLFLFDRDIASLSNFW